MKFLSNILKFFWLTYFKYPYLDIKKGLTMTFLLNFIVLPPIIGLVMDFSNPFTAPWEPDLLQLSEAEVHEGVVFRDRDRGSKNRSESFKLQTAQGEKLYFRCHLYGLKCFDNAEWDGFVGQPAKVWSYKDWALQIEVNGRSPEYGSYEHFAKLYKSRTIDFLLWISRFFLACLLVRSTLRYSRVAFREVWQHS